MPVLYSYTAMIPSILPSTGPIGVFDSGYGGLTILDKIRGLMPEYDYIYLGDSARCPYGPRSFEVVYEFTLQAVSKLFELGCPLVILACNTASAKALRTIQQINLPVIDATRRVLGVIRPTAECIGEITRSRHVGILATAGTIKSESYLLEIHKLSPDIVVTGEACPMWVSLVENNEYQSEGADYFVKQHINRLLDKDPMIDTIILGCTHYPLLLDKIRQFTPEPIRIISQGEYVARSLRDYLNRHPEMDARCDKGGNCRFLTTESENKFEESASIFLGRHAWYLIWRLSRKWIPHVRELTVRMWLVIDIISLASAVGLITFIYYSPMDRAYTSYPACIACFLTSMGALYLTSYVAKTIKSNMEMQNLKYQQSYYEELEENQKTVRKIRHDMKNHLSVIYSFIQNRDFHGAEKYFRELSGELTVNNRIFCKNSIVNAVLNSKYNTALENKVDCFFNISIDGLLGIDDISLCSLFSNTLDNAIEACEKIQDTSKRQISLKARYDKGYFSYEISNSKRNPITVKKNRYVTEKTDKTLHGFGVQNVRDMVEKYAGDMDISYTDDRFTITILIGNL